jgi:hypothetical protein
MQLIIYSFLFIISIGLLGVPLFLLIETPFSKDYLVLITLLLLAGITLLIFSSYQMNKTDKKEIEANAKELTKSISTNNILIKWDFSDEDWSRFIKDHSKKSKNSTISLSIYLPIILILINLFIVYVLGVNESKYHINFITAFIIILFWSLSLNLYLAQNKKIKYFLKSPKSVNISKEIVWIGHYKHIFMDENMKILKVLISAENEAPFITITSRIDGADSDYVEFIPFPNDKRNEALDWIKSLNNF